jgi:endonuclease III
MILYENAAYLVEDEQRNATWAALRKFLGGRPTPQRVLDADRADLIEAIRGGGMQPSMRAEKLRRAARIAMDRFDGDLEALLKAPLKKARSGLKRFPGIGDPGADKILLFTRTAPVLALDSNGLRALLRLGHGSPEGGYAAQYRSVQEAVEPEVRSEYDWLIAAHQLLREHGKVLCRRSARCRECPLAKGCPAAAGFLRAGAEGAP